MECPEVSPIRLDELRSAVQGDTIETVVVAFTDPCGPTPDKRFEAGHFPDHCVDDGTHACGCLLTVDMEMDPVEGYDFANRDRVDGDLHLVPDLSTLRHVAWGNGARSYCAT